MAMSGKERREQIIKILNSSETPVAGTELAKELGVSRQVIVQDMALIRANGIDVMATNRGYVIQETKEASRVFKVHRKNVLLCASVIENVCVNAASKIRKSGLLAVSCKMEG